MTFSKSEIGVVVGLSMLVGLGMAVRDMMQGVVARALIAAVVGATLGIVLVLVAKARR